MGGDRLRVRLTNIYGEQAVRSARATVAKPNNATPGAVRHRPGTVRTLTFNGSGTAIHEQGQRTAQRPGGPAARRRSTTWSSACTSRSPPARPRSTARRSRTTSSARRTWSTRPTARRSPPTRPAAGSSCPASTCRPTRSRRLDRRARRLDRRRQRQHRQRQQPLARPARRAAGRRRPGQAYPGRAQPGLAGNRLNHEGTEPRRRRVPRLLRARRERAGPAERGRVRADRRADRHHPPGHQRHLDVRRHRRPRSSARCGRSTPQVKERGLRSLVTTITPFEGLGGTGSWTPAKEATRQAVNSYLRVEPRVRRGARLRQGAARPGRAEQAAAERTTRVTTSTRTTPATRRWPPPCRSTWCADRHAHRQRDPCRAGIRGRSPRSDAALRRAASDRPGLPARAREFAVRRRS